MIDVLCGPLIARQQSAAQIYPHTDSGSDGQVICAGCEKSKQWGSCADVIRPPSASVNKIFASRCHISGRWFSNIAAPSVKFKFTPWLVETLMVLEDAAILEFICNNHRVKEISSPRCGTGPLRAVSRSNGVIYVGRSRRIRRFRLRGRTAVANGSTYVLLLWQKRGLVIR